MSKYGGWSEGVRSQVKVRMMIIMMSNAALSAADVNIEMPSQYSR